MEEKTEKTFHLLGIIAGVIVDNLGTFMSSGLMGSIYLSLHEGDKEELIQVYNHIGWLILFMVVGMLWSFFGGYVAARVARRAELINAACIGVIGAGIEFDSFISNPGIATWYQVIGLLIVIPVSLLGGKMALRKKQRSTT
ncbi:hypothetical protein [Paenibacillus hexagrammi]|uniref:Uncharacterized protein n=1 Tax=Paenibacillus hexagrammi TaxID=2908839 RepID=A0ABY3SCM2_9BACL|nr:hypothetical protein [Paenibacillus sp. YPD9-1]UJF31230.1 hypothetical protein L0M14_15235 [Paenibacillus sp. YPD9-1]